MELGESRLHGGRRGKKFNHEGHEGREEERG
jgi:hypothetical protein